MKLQEYDGRKVITLESINEYSLKPEYEEQCKNWFYGKLGKNNGTLLRPNEAKNYGQKNFNYAKGLWVYNIDAVVNIAANCNDFLRARFDVDTFLSDIKKGDIRAVQANTKKKNKTAVVKTEPKVVPVKKPAPTISPMQNSFSQTMFEEVYALIDRMNENTIRVLSAHNQKLQEQVEALTEKVDFLTAMIEKTAEEKSTNNILEAPIILKENSSYEEWLKGIKKAIKLIRDIDDTKVESNILHEAYDRIRTQYGVVWEQEAKEFREDYGRSPVNTRELCWWMETNKPIYKNLLIGKLNTMYSETKRGIA